MHPFSSHEGKSTNRSKLQVDKRKKKQSDRNRTFVSLCPGAARCDAGVPTGLLRHLASRDPKLRACAPFAVGGSVAQVDLSMYVCMVIKPAHLHTQAESGAYLRDSYRQVTKSSK